MREGVSIRDLEGILEALLEAGGSTDDVDVLIESVRASMSRSLSQQYCGEDGRLWCVSLDAALERQLCQRGGPDESVRAAAIAPDVSRQVADSVQDGLERLRRQGRRPIVLCDPQIRPAVKRMLEPSAPDVAVLGYNEVDSVQVEPLESTGIGT